jgi:fucose permease
MGPFLAASVTGYLVSSFSGGAVVRRTGVGRLLLGSSVLIVASLGGYAAAPVWGAMVGCAVLAGLGAGAIDAGINAYAADCFSPRLVNWLHACYGVGATLGPLTMTAVLAAGRSWRWGYVVLAIVLAGIAVGFWLTLELWEDRKARGFDVVVPNGPAAGAVDVGPREADRRATIGQALRRPLVWAGIGLFFLYTGLEVTAGQWAYSLFTEARGVAPAVAGAWVGAFWGCLTAGRVAFGAAAGRVPTGRLLRVGLVGAPVAAGLVWWNAGGVAAFVGLALLGLSLAPIYPLLISLTPGRVGRAYAAHAIGFQVSAAYLGAAALPGLAGVLARRVGLEVVGPMMLVAALALLALHEAVRWASSHPSSSRAGPIPQAEHGIQTRATAVDVAGIEE